MSNQFPDDLYSKYYPQGDQQQSNYGYNPLPPTQYQPPLYSDPYEQPQQPHPEVYGNLYAQSQQPGVYAAPGGYGYAPYGAAIPVAPPDRAGGFAIAGLVLGIVSIIGALLPICGFPLSIVGIVMAALGRRSISRRTMATIGLVLSIIALVLTAINSALGVYLQLHH